MTSGANILETIFYTNTATWHRVGGRTAIGETTNDIDVRCSVNTGNIVVVDQNGSEIIASAVVCMTDQYGLPSVGDYFTLPAKFGAKQRRKVVAVKNADNNHEYAPNHIEVKLQ